MSKTVLCGGLNMPTVGLGTWQSTDESELEAALNASLEAGYRHIDTAHAYGNEHVIGRVLDQWFSAGKLKRENLFIVTKLPIQAVHPDRVEKYIKESLDKLKLDYVDLYLIHYPIGMTEDKKGFEEEDHQGVWKSMEKQVDDGRAKTIGVSNFTIKQIDRILKFARIKPACNQVEIHVFMQQQELVQFCQKNGIVVVAYSPLGSPGYNQFLKKIGQGERQDLVNVLTNPVIAEIAKKHNKTAAHVALRFLLQKNIVVIPKSVSPARVISNFQLHDFNLSDEEIKKIENLNVGEKARVCDWMRTGYDHPEYPFGRTVSTL